MNGKINGNDTNTIDRTDWPIQKTSVYKFSMFYKSINNLNQPAQKPIDKKIEGQIV